jgi:uncharacterized protein YjbJ (UPF0337 family)
MARMGTADKINNAMEDMTGKAKEAAGKFTGDRDAEREGQGDQARGQMKQAGENIKDAAKSFTGE